MKEFLTPATSERLEGIGEYYFSRKLREIDALKQAGHPVISLGIGSPDRPPHPSVVEVLCRTARRSDAHAYQSYKGTARLREAFARWYGDRYGAALDPAAEILPLIGSKEGLIHICMTFLRRGEQVLIPDPGYPTYRSAVRLAGGEPAPYVLTARNGWLPDFDELERRDLSRVKMMILNYPQMPTGAIPTREMFARAVEFALRNDVMLVHDNPYGFIRNDEPLSLLATPGAKGCSIELNSLSKSHNMAGWRIGMIGARREWIDAILRFKSNMDSGQFLPVQEAAAAALALGDDWYAEQNRVYRSREKAGMELLDALGCRYEPRQAGLFLWARLPEEFPGDCYAFSDRLLERCDLFVTPGAVFGEAGLRYIRISLCAPEETLREAEKRIREQFIR